MIDKKVWFITGPRRGLGVEISNGEPSHIHIPRRRRVARNGDQGTSATRGAHVSDEEYGAAPLARNDLQPAGKGR